MPKNMKRVYVLFSIDEFKRLQAIAEIEQESLSALIRKAVDQVYLYREEQGRLAAVRQMASLDLTVADWEQLERESTETAFAATRNYQPHSLDRAR